jgi:tRNA (guanine37-N1)-methyltransferase
MLKIHIITLFPEYFKNALEIGPIRKAIELGELNVSFLNLKDFADSPKEVDDYPFGGGSGMILKVEPIKRAIDSVKEKESKVILLSPQGITFNQKLAHELKEEKHLIIICGRYKDVDDRVRKYVDLEISIGDYILSGGEPAALVLIDAISRLLPGALGDKDSAQTDSFETGLLDAPYYTRPRIFNGMEVPQVLLSGNHEKIKRWRKKESLRRTLKRRPDLLKKVKLTEEEKKLLDEILREEDSST